MKIRIIGFDIFVSNSQNCLVRSLVVTNEPVFKPERIQWTDLKVFCLGLELVA